MSALLISSTTEALHLQWNNISRPNELRVRSVETSDWLDLITCLPNISRQMRIRTALFSDKPWNRLVCSFTSWPWLQMVFLCLINRHLLLYGTVYFVRSCYRLEETHWCNLHPTWRCRKYTSPKHWYIVVTQKTTLQFSLSWKYEI
jgi:hypothetical protein